MNLLAFNEELEEVGNNSRSFQALVLWKVHPSLLMRWVSEMCKIV